MPVPPPLLQDCIPGEHLLYTFCYNVEFHPRTCFKQDENQNKVQGIILLESNSATLDIWDNFTNVKANDRITFIRTFEFNMIHTTTVFRYARNLAAGYSGQELFRF